MIPIHYYSSARTFVQNHPFQLLALGLAVIGLGKLCYKIISWISEPHGITKKVNEIGERVFSCFHKSSAASTNLENKPEKEKLVITPYIYHDNAKVTQETRLPLSSVNLEEKLMTVCTQKVDIKANCNFTDYLRPNEGRPENIQEHLKKGERGLIVSVGTERSFFDLIFSDPAQCTGLVVVDINPKVKAYVDFNTLLLRLSASREDYRQLSTLFEYEYDYVDFSQPDLQKALERRISIIQEKINHSDLPESLRTYYSTHLSDFALIYYKEAHWWKNGPHYGRGEGERPGVFNECRYDLNDDQFYKLQSYAKNGSIISVTGSILDLRFLDEEAISVIDTSNVGDYVILDIATNSHPRVIWTGQDFEKTLYFSYLHEPITQEEREECDRYFEQLKKAGIDPNYSWLKNNFSKSNNQIKQEKFHEIHGGVYCRTVLNQVRHDIQNYLYDIDGELYYVHDFFSNGEKLQSAPLKHLQELSKQKRLCSSLDELISAWTTLTPSRYFAFKEMEGWKEAFENRMQERWSGFHNFLKKLNRKERDDFVNWFGKERLQKIAQFQEERDEILAKIG